MLNVSYQSRNWCTTPDILGCTSQKYTKWLHLIVKLRTNKTCENYQSPPFGDPPFIQQISDPSFSNFWKVPSLPLRKTGGSNYVNPGFFLKYITGASNLSPGYNTMSIFAEVRKPPYKMIKLDEEFSTGIIFLRRFPRTSFFLSHRGGSHVVA